MNFDGREFEVNTDASFVDPDWEEFVEQHEHRYGLAIHHLKSVVRGDRFDNEAMKLRVGPEGYYVQSRRFPAAFFGGTQPPVVREVDEDEARAVVWEAVAAYRAGDARSLTCIYVDGDPSDVFFGYRTDDGDRYELGELRLGLPIHVRATIDADERMDTLGSEQGTVIYQRTSDGRHVVLTSRGRHPPFMAATALEG